MSIPDEDDARCAMLLRAVGDKNSEYYKKLCRMLFDATAIHVQAKSRAPHVTVPFPLGGPVQARLEHQFGIIIKTTMGTPRSRNTEGVAALICVLDAALVEHAESGGRSAYYLDGDAVSVAAMGIERRCVERTHSHSRAAAGYFEEDLLLERLAGDSSTTLRVNAGMFVDQMSRGGGDNFSERVRVDGERFDSVVFNHMKTPVGVAQAAYLVKCRGRVGVGVLPFQPDMRYREAGNLECFPGRFYVDREADMITLVPYEDPTMSVSHSYSGLMSFIDNNSVMVDGVEFLCEKYAKVPGFLYYTLTPVNGSYEAPETLRSYYYDTELAKVSRVTFPEVRFSEEGVPIGYKVGEVLVPTMRLEKVIAKAMLSTKDIVTPAEVMTVLVNENNMTLNTMDSARHSERIDVEEEIKLSVAIALHVSWRRHAAKGTFNVLLDTVRLRNSAAEMSVLKFARLALCAWWQSPKVNREGVSGLPVAKVLDWCGNDFSVVIDEVDPWIEIASVDALTDFSRIALNHMMPKPPHNKPRFVRPVVPYRWSVPIDKPSVKLSRSDATMDRVGMVGGAVDVVTQEVVVPKAVACLTDLKQRQHDKMMTDTYGVVNPEVERVRTVYVGKHDEGRVWAAVPEVDPVMAIRGDLDEMVGGLPERDALQTGYALAETEEFKTTVGCMNINDAKRNLPKGRTVRRPKVDAGVEGLRVQSSAALAAAMFKRNIGIPDNLGAVDLDLTPDLHAQMFADVCFVDDWKERVNLHLENGMWEPDSNDIQDYIAGIDEFRVERMIKEFFQEGNVSLDAWHLMAKGKVKPSRETASESKVDHSQTILFLESMNTNGMYSSILRRVKKCVDDILQPGIRINAQWSPQESEDWYNSIEPVRKSCGTTYTYDVDSKAFDRSQGHPCLRAEMAVHRLLGLTEERYAMWEKTHGKKKAMNMAFGIMAIIVLTGISGLWSTLYRNGVVQTIAVIVSAKLRRGDIVTMQVTGDDVDLETRRPVKVETAVERMSLAFNLSSKFNTTVVRYFCKKFRIKIDGWWYEVADPWARAQSTCTPVILESGASPSLVERWVSLRAELIHYDNGILLDAVAEATKVYYGLPIVPYGLTRGLAALVNSKSKFMSFFHPPEAIF